MTEVFVNGKQVQRIDLLFNVEKDVEGFHGKIGVVFLDGSELIGKIIKRVQVPQLHPLQHLYEVYTFDGKIIKVAVEFFNN